MITGHSSIRDALSLINKNSMQFVVVIDENQKILGTVTDGDIRRGLLNGKNVESKVTAIMNPNPVIGDYSAGRKAALNLMQEREIRQLPLVDASGKLMHVLTYENLHQIFPRKNTVVLMAGGLGERLRPLTDHCPKPMLKVGKKPILETTLERLIEAGFSNFKIAVNYKAEVIESYFESGEKWDVSIQYLREKTRLGTAGALGLLDQAQQDPILVMNADLLTLAPFGELMDSHLSSACAATMCVREHSIQVPYGVIQLEGQFIKSIDEKPIQRFFVNAGIYLLSPEALSLVPRDTPMDMTSLFEQVAARGLSSRAETLYDYWCDIGRLSDYEKANQEFDQLFSNHSKSSH